MASFTHRGPFPFQAVVRRRSFDTETEAFETKTEAHVLICTGT